MKIQSVHDASFRAYGRVIDGIDCTELLEALGNTPAPSDVVYVSSVPEFESLSVFKVFEDVVYGGMPVQLGYCNGTNSALNAVEYHRDSEINLAQSDLIMLYGLEKDIDLSDYSYDTSKIEAFFVPAGTLIECFATTLHYAPCSAKPGQPFRCLIALPRGTNEELPRPRGTAGEDQLLTHVNKWLIAHPDSGIQGAHMGLVGENLKV